MILEANSNLRAHVGAAPKLEVERVYSRIGAALDQWAWYQDGILLSEIERRIPRSAERILDLCCGTGILSRHLALKRPQTSLTGVDISAAMVALAREKTVKLANVEIQCGDWVEKLNPQVRYDCVVIKNALHLLGNIRQRMLQLRQLCHSQTRIIVCETVSPNQRCLEFITTLFEIINADQYGKTFFSASALYRQLENFGLVRLETTTFMRQYIDPAIWLEAKCTDPAQLVLATKFVKASAGGTPVGKAMAIRLDADGSPRQMLRLQQIETLKFQAELDALSRKEVLPTQLSLFC